MTLTLDFAKFDFYGTPQLLRATLSPIRWHKPKFFTSIPQKLTVIVISQLKLVSLPESRLGGIWRLLAWLAPGLPRRTPSTWQGTSAHQKSPSLRWYAQAGGHDRTLVPLVIYCGINYMLQFNCRFSSGFFPTIFRQFQVNTVHIGNSDWPPSRGLRSLYNIFRNFE